MLPSDWPEVQRLAQAYVTAAYPGVYKAWHRRRRQTDHFLSPQAVAQPSGGGATP